MRKIFLLLIVLIMVCLVGCEDSLLHQHTYSDQWSSDENGHWHASDCEHAGLESDRSVHQYGDGVPDVATDMTTYVCTVCKFEIKLPSGQVPENPIQIQCLDGTQNCYKIEGNTIIFSGITSDSIYSISGKLQGNIIIEVADEYQFELEMHGLELSCDYTSPIMILSGDQVTLTAKKDYVNTITDLRAAVSENDPSQKAATIYAACDLEIGGKGTLRVISQYNNGIHTKDDLEVKNLALSVTCVDNALKGNDSVTIKSGSVDLTATAGDGIKTVNTDVSGKGKQRGIISIIGGTVNICAAKKCLDPAFDLVVDEVNCVLNMTKYS